MFQHSRCKAPASPAPLDRFADRPSPSLCLNRAKENEHA